MVWCLGFQDQVQKDAIECGTDLALPQSFSSLPPVVSISADTHIQLCICTYTHTYTYIYIYIYMCYPPRVIHPLGGLNHLRMVRLTGSGHWRGSGFVELKLNAWQTDRKQSVMGIRLLR